MIEPRLLRTARWMSQSYRNQDIIAGGDGGTCFHEEMRESCLAYELPAKWLMSRIDDLVDEYAKLEGKAGEMEIILAQSQENPTAGYVEHAFTGDIEHDIVMIDSVDRQRRLQWIAYNTLQELMEECGSQARNYKTMADYYRKCLTTGMVTKRSVQRKEGALRAVPTNLHVYTVVPERTRGG